MIWKQDISTIRSETNSRAKLEALFVLDEKKTRTEHKTNEQENNSLLLELKGHGELENPKEKKRKRRAQSIKK